LSGDDLKRLVVGNSITGIYSSDAHWTEYYDPDGQIRGVDDGRGKYAGTYRIRGGNMVCFDYPGHGDDWCTRISLAGDKVTLIEPSGEIDPGSHDERLIKGNPQQL